jgi:broad specificity phosphatase PhoE
MRLFIIRHGQCIGGDDDNPRLTALGERQAHETGRRLQNEGISHVVSSPIVRALATAAIMVEELGLSSVEAMPDLQEHHLETYRVFGRADLQRLFPLAHLPQSVGEQHWDVGGETFEAVAERAQAVISLLCERFALDEQVAIVTHGGFTNALLRSMLQMAPASPARFQLHNGGITLVDFERLARSGVSDGGTTFQPIVATINDTCHLSERSLVAGAAEGGSA